jgi:hypothetical protein
MMPTTRHRRALWSALAIGAVTLAGGSALAVASDAPPDARPRGPRVQTIRLAEASETARLTSVDLGEPGPSPGDKVVVTDGVVREGHGAAGTFSQDCTLTEVGRSFPTSTFERAGSIALAEGVITHHGPFVPARPEQKVAVTGGTGAFRTAHGEVSVEAEADRIVVSLIR